MSLETDVENMVKAAGMELYDTAITSRNGETIYEVMVTSAEGVTLDQCAELSHMLSPLLDVTPPVSGEYRLEVGTPGVERKLKSIRHFEKSLGELAKVTLITGEHFQGKLLRIEGETIFIDDKESGEQSFSLSEIQKARTYFEW